MRRLSISVRVGGAAGQGVKSVGKLIQKYFQELNFFTFGYLGYPSLIRGGYNFYQVDFAPAPIETSTSQADIFIPLDKKALAKISSNSSFKGTILYDSNLSRTGLAGRTAVKIGLTDELAKNKIPQIMINTALVGCLAKLFGYPFQPLESVIKKIYKNKPKLVIKDNLKAARLGYNFNLQTSFKKSLALIKPQLKNKLVLSGNEAIALGFIAGGGKFYTAYPMTPATNILHYLTRVGPKKKIVVRQASTEIEAIGSALGASYAGARSMIATSGGGIDLMSEFISLAGMMEIPLVIVDAQRVGPATGLPTWQEQSDLNIAKHAGHGEFPRLVIAPGDAGQAFYLTQEALNLADEYQMPVIILSDKHLSESIYTLEKDYITGRYLKIKRGKIISQIDKEYFLYPRYDLKQTISPRPLPGSSNGLYIANSDEHNQYGQSLESDPVRIEMQSKRLKKMTILKKKLPLPRIYGPKKAATALVGWGSTKGTILETQRHFQNLGQNIAFIHFTYLYPLDYRRLEKLVKNYRRFILIENNSTGQLKSDLIQSGVKENKIETVLKYDGQPFFIDELIKKINKLVKQK